MGLNFALQEGDPVAEEPSFHSCGPKNKKLEKAPKTKALMKTYFILVKAELLVEFLLENRIIFALDLGD